MTTVDAIAAAAFSAVASQITDSVHSASLTDGTTTYTGRVVFGGENAPSGFPMADPANKVRQAYLEGFGVAPSSGWTITDANSVTHYITSRRDIVEARGLTVANVIAEGDLIWLTGDIQAPARIGNGAGGYTTTWAAITGGDDVSVGMWSMSGGERWASERLEATSMWRAVLPYLDGVTEKCRLVVGGRYYAITFSDDAQKRGAWLVLDLGQGVAP